MGANSVTTISRWHLTLKKWFTVLFGGVFHFFYVTYYPLIVGTPLASVKGTHIILWLTPPYVKILAPPLGGTHMCSSKERSCGTCLGDFILFLSLLGDFSLFLFFLGDFILFISFSFKGFYFISFSLLGDFISPFLGDFILFISFFFRGFYFISFSLFFKFLFKEWFAKLYLL